MCIRRSPYFDNFQNLKKIIIIIVSISFRNWSNPYTRPLADPCFLKLTRAHALLEVVKIVNWRDPCFIHLRSPEQYEKMPCLSGSYELSVTIEKKVLKKWKWVQEVDADRGPFRHWGRRFDEPRVATKKLKIVN